MPLIRAISREFLLYVDRGAPPFAAPCTTHNREAGGSNPPGAMKFRSGMQFLLATAAMRRDPLWREVVDRQLPALQSAIGRSCVHESPFGRPPRVHNQSPLATKRGLCRPLAREHRREI